MTAITYIIVEHDGGWAYRLGDVYSETFATHEDAKGAAEAAAAEQKVEKVRVLSSRDDEEAATLLKHGHDAAHPDRPADNR